MTVSPPRNKIIGITAGDPAGIGAELAQQILATPPLPGTEFRQIGRVAPLSPGNPSRESAACAIDALEEAAHLALRGEIDAVVTGPVCKHRMRAAGFAFPGQTEFFAARAGVDNFAMLLTGGSITVALVTAHVPLRAVPDLLNPNSILRVGELLCGFLQKRGIENPRIAVAGLNPHAGEAGDLGREELEIIIPAIRQLQIQLPQAAVSGPHPPDTVFFQAASGSFDGVLCMFHDQGLIPLKLHAFHSGVNVTLGLPFVRTSPDHGTAFDLAGTGKASAESFRHALALAAELVCR